MNDLRFWVENIVTAVRGALAEERRQPETTYRLQFHHDRMTFRHVAALAPYLHELGISHVYASPSMKASTGSPHGYDVVDHGRLNSELGTAGDYAAMIDSLHQQAMGMIQDIVPNHMGIVTTENAWWNDVLENGPSSPYAVFFDIDWRPIKPELKNKVLLPFLGGQYGEVLESGQLQLEYRDGAFFLRHFGQHLPLDPRTFPVILTYRLDELKEVLGAESEELRELESILTALEYLPPVTETETDRIAERQREKEVVKGRIRHLVAGCPAIADFIHQNLSELNGVPGDVHSFDRLDHLLNSQVYRLAHWKAASDEINYRRFFDINDLAAVCTEEPQVFDAIHRLVFEQLIRGDVDGLRVDHIDGLYNPRKYLWRLQWGYVRARGYAAYQRLLEEQTAAPRTGEETTVALSKGAVSFSSNENGDEPPLINTPVDEPPCWEVVEPLVLRALWEERGGPPPPGVVFEEPLEEAADHPRADDAAERPMVPLPVYVVVEKILGPDEPLPESWPVAGTTGYDFLNAVNRLFVDCDGLDAITKTYQRFTGERTSFRQTAYQARLLILRVSMSSDLHLLAHRINRISERNRRSRDFTLNSLRIVLRELLTCFPVYRTYVCEGQVSDRDRQMIHRAVAQAKRRNPARDAAEFDFIRDVLLLEQPPELDEAGRRDRELFVGRFQQVTSPLVAKGVEDTAFYLYFPLASLNEVGGDPGKGAATVDDFHHENLDRQAGRSGSLVATTTHDTKRSEDVRARISVLSEIPQQWRSAVNRWARLNRRHRCEVDGLPAPSRNDEYLLYQTLIGIWPLEPLEGGLPKAFVERVQSYMEKATREAKRRTSWISPNVEYDDAVRDFVAAVLDDHPKNRFLAEFAEFENRIVNWGLYSALSQVLLKLTSPGVPDIYQGQELWEFLLVDPDNRRPTDFAHRQELLDQLQAAVSAGPEARLALARELAFHPRDGRLKMLVTWQTLQFRRRHAELFHRGRYEPLTAEGAAAEHVCAFAWRWTPSPEEPEQVVVVAVPRLAARLALQSDGADESPTTPLSEALWAETRLILPSGIPWTMKNLFTCRECSADNDRIPLSALFSDFPVALLSNLE